MKTKRGWLKGPRAIAVYLFYRSGEPLVALASGGNLPIEAEMLEGLLSVVGNFVETSVRGARGYAEGGFLPGGAFDNLHHFGERVHFGVEQDEPARMLLFDPQTSGGLLLGVPAAELEKLQARAKELNQPIWIIGNVMAGSGIQVN